MPSDLDGMACALSDLRVLGSYTRRLSSAVESLPDLTEDLRVNQQDGPVPPQVVCNQIAIHTQAAAAGIDHARTAVSMAHRLSGRLRMQGHWPSAASLFVVAERDKACEATRLGALDRLGVKSGYRRR